MQWGQPGESGWGTVMATDTAFVIGCLALLGTRIPHSLRVFMLSLEIALHPWVGFVIMPLFAFANAGVPLSFAGLRHSVTLAVLIGFTIGKPVGILTFSWLAVRTGIARRPADLDWGLLAGGGLLAGIGFTMALFIANLALDQRLIDSAKSGIFLASVVSTVASLALLRTLPGRGPSPLSWRRLPYRPRNTRRTRPPGRGGREF
jgi:Na+/H+ antiporter NhaA